jgi:hypothetical protein
LTAAALLCGRASATSPNVKSDFAHGAFGLDVTVKGRPLDGVLGYGFLSGRAASTDHPGREPLRLDGPSTPARDGLCRTDPSGHEGAWFSAAARDGNSDDPSRAINGRGGAE